MKKLFFDLETTGTKFWKHGIHQIAAIVEIDGVEVERIDIKVKPYHKAEILQEALDVGGVTLQDLEGYKAMKDGKIEFTRMLNRYVDRYNKKDKFHLVGFNNRSFDDPFLRAFFEYNDDNYLGSWFWSDSLDVLVLASDALQNERHSMLNFKLGTVCKYLGMEFDNDKAHDGLYDVSKTKELYYLLKMI